MTSNISDKDQKDWKNFLEKNERLPNKDLEKKKSKFYTTKSLDLHGYTLDEANKKVESFIIDCFEQKVSKIKIVTGKGLHSQNDKDPYISKKLGILKNSVPDFIKSNPSLMTKIKSIADAEIADGGSGAFYVFLKKKL
ncbi:Smr/MutS family protein [Candidatus Pelagibacter sp.]|nr:Smr/MutS family protein [Candidatus Pelagibacter sp.]